MSESSSQGGESLASGPVVVVVHGIALNTGRTREGLYGSTVPTKASRDALAAANLADVCDVERGADESLWALPARSLERK